MAETELILEPEVEQILKHIDAKENFLLSGGAGSGKTYSLVSVIRNVIATNPYAKIACMTYTNAAVKEIEERVNHKNLTVSTIHDFLWDNIKHFQKELKAVLVELANADPDSVFSIDGFDPLPTNHFDSIPDGIQYKEYLRIREGIISHDELLIVAEKLFAKYVRLNDIIKDKFPFIFIDEYQDTSKSVVDILLVHFKQSNKKCVVGFFGDAMQSIYDDTIGNLDAYKEAYAVHEVKKAANRRNPQKVIDLANVLRTDGITQTPSTDEHAPNMIAGKVKEGVVLFIHSSNENLEPVKKFLAEKHGWNFSNTKATKELNLTHNLIADKAEFRTLMDIYDKDKVLDFRTRIKDYIKDNAIAEDFSNKTFGEVIQFLQSGKSSGELKKVSPTKGQQEFIDSHGELYNYAKGLSYVEFSRLYVSKDQLVDDKKQDADVESKKGSKRDNLIKHLFKIQNNIQLYTDKKYNQFLRITDYRTKILKVADKKDLQQKIEELVNVNGKTIEDVIQLAHDSGICLISDHLVVFKQRYDYIYRQVAKVPFVEFQKLYNYLEGYTPFSTKHKTKGDEFDNVLVVLDNGDWNKYNFESLFTNRGTASVVERSRKLFYVSCTRAKEQLAVFYVSPSPEVIKIAESMFGAESIVKV